MPDLRWDGDEVGEGVADAASFLEGARELTEAMRRPNWVTEQPELHLLPHLESACRSLPLRLVDAQTSGDGCYEVRLEWTDGKPGVGAVRAAVFSLVGSVSELSSYIRQRRDEGTLTFEVVTGMVDGETRFAPHGHTLRFTVPLHAR